MGNDEQWMRLALAVLKQAEADYKFITILMGKKKRYTADNIAKLHKEFTTPMMGLLCPMGIEETLALWDKKYGGAPIEEVMNYPETDEPKKIKEGGKDHD